MTTELKPPTDSLTGVAYLQNSALLNFANTVSHNLRSYANNLETMLAMYECEQDAVERETLFGYIKEISSGFKLSVDQLADVVKVHNAGHLPLHQVNLHDCAVQVAGVLRTQLHATGATLLNNIGPDVYIEANPAYVESIVLNFVDNAIKYRHPDRKPCIELSTMVVGNETVLSIIDNGLGMNLDKDRSKLYGMYNTFHGNPDATGIGLFITKYQVERMGGHIGVESHPGEGTWFRVYFQTRINAQ